MSSSWNLHLSIMFLADMFQWLTHQREKKGKGIPITGHEGHGRCGCKVHIYIATAPGRGRVACPKVGRLYPRESPQYSFYRRLSAPQAQSRHQVVKKILHPSNTRDRIWAAQPVVKRLVTWATWPTQKEKIQLFTRGEIKSPQGRKSHPSWQYLFISRQTVKKIFSFTIIWFYKIIFFAVANLYIKICNVQKVADSSNGHIIMLECEMSPVTCVSLTL